MVIAASLGWKNILAGDGWLQGISPDGKFSEMSLFASRDAMIPAIESLSEINRSLFVSSPAANGRGVS